MNEKAQSSSQLLLMMIMMFLFIFIFGDPGIRAWIAVSLNPILYSLIGFNGKYPLLTIVLAGIIVIFLSSFFTNLFTDWKAVGRAQEINKAFQKELSKARREGNTNRINKLMKMQPQIMNMTTKSQSGMMKSMVFLSVFIAPIFIWLLYFLANIQYYYFTVPWAENISLFKKDLIMSNWFLLYLIFSMTLGQVIRQGLKWISWSNWWLNIRKKIKPS
ncbi:MAG: hypothetical protein DRN08_05380 [Thermoplasmata archaeon]|nr:MAG: hypothetical protein DRN05_03760 [Thermoplasmata archaeon]RLF33580.1 MAG: hypothetical protein DRN08_05380 [Thermoplasmata archaeon]